jgi:hypothetical protein
VGRLRALLVRLRCLRRGHRYVLDGEALAFE